MTPLLMIAELLSRKGALRNLGAERRAAFPSSGEINFVLEDVPAAVARVRTKFEPKAKCIYETDGLSLDMDAWRFNLRASNTEPVLRLNIETRGDAALLAESVARVQKLVDR
jgi:phosphomannomutase